MFEIHLTIEVIDQTAETKFRHWSFTTDNKIAILELSDGRIDMMTSVRTGNLVPDYVAMKASLEQWGFNVIRTKIETVPWVDREEVLYYEAHLDCRLDGYPFARNIAKTNKWSSTIRTDGLEIYDILKTLPEGIEYEVEAIVFDDNRAHDDSWINMLK